jgi:hypothetical protein
VSTMESQASLVIGLSAREATIFHGIEARRASNASAEFDSITELSCLQFYLHQQALVGVVCLGEHRPWSAPTGLLDDVLDDGR